MFASAAGRRPWAALATLALGLTLVAPAIATAQSSEPAFRPACLLADDAAASAALGMDVVGDDSISNLLCTYTAGSTPVAVATLTADLSLDLAKMAFPDAIDITIGGAAGIASPGDESSMPPTVMVSLADGGLLMVNVMPDAGLPDPVAAATALAEALVASGPVTATLPDEVSGPAITFSGDPCDLVSLDEIGGIVGSDFTTAEPDGSGGCTFQTDMNEAMVLAGLAFSDGTLGALRSGSTTDLTVADRSAVWWPDLSSLFVDLGGGRLMSVLLMSLSAPAEGGQEQAQAQAAAIAELAISRMTPAAG